MLKRYKNSGTGCRVTDSAKNNKTCQQWENKEKKKREMRKKWDKSK